jgi:hypothetical protein
MDISIENYPVSDLPLRFLIGKQALYNRLDALDLKPTKVGKRAFVNGEQLKLLDELHAHILEGKTMAEFKSATSQLDKVDKSSGLTTEHPETLTNLIEVISKAIERTTPQRSPLWYMNELEQAVNKNWWLTTSEIQRLIGVKPVTQKGTQAYPRGCFLFTKAGKLGRQTVWKIDKIPSIDR